MEYLRNEDELTDIDEGDEGDDEKYEPATFRYDPDKINIVTKQPTIEQLLRRIGEKALNLAPDFQRQAGIWDQEAKSRLIESVLIRIPLPAFYIDATDEENWLVVDGLQRLSALKSFVDKKLELKGLEYLKELEGKNYSELERRYQRRIEETQVQVYSIEKGTPDEVKYNIFKRINTGGVALSNQELRHALNPGKSIKFLRQLAELKEFQRVIKLSDNKRKRMDDREFVLGFLAFYLTSYKDYYKDGDRDTFLSKALSKMNHISDEQLAEIEIIFKNVMVTAFEIFGSNAFRKISNNNKRQYPVNKALFEGWSVCLSKLNNQEIQHLKQCKQKLIDIFVAYVDNDKEFFSSISQAQVKVEYRFTTIDKIIREVLS